MPSTKGGASWNLGKESLYQLMISFLKSNISLFVKSSESVPLQSQQLQALKYGPLQPPAATSESATGPYFA